LITLAEPPYLHLLVMHMPLGERVRKLWHEEDVITDRYHVPLAVAIRTVRVSRTWPGVRRWTGGGIRAHPESERGVS